MPRYVLWLARLALVLLVAYTAYGAWNPRHNAQAFPVEKDEIEHLLLSYGLVVLASASFPRVNPYHFGLLVLAAGVGLEVAQAMKWVSGGYELRDVLAGAAGVLLAVVPMYIVQRGGRARR